MIRLQAHLAIDNGIKGSIFWLHDTTCVFQIEGLEGAKASRLPLKTLGNPVETDLVIQTAKDKYVCESRDYVPILGTCMTNITNIMDVACRIKTLIKRFEVVRQAAEIHLAGVLGWENHFYGFVSNVEEITANRRTMQQITPNNCFHYRRKQHPKILFGAYSTNHNNLYLSLRIVLGTGTIKTVQLAYDTSNAAFIAILKCPKGQSDELKASWDKEVQIYEELKELMKRKVAMPGLLLPIDILRYKKGLGLRVKILVPKMNTDLRHYLNANKGRLSTKDKEILFYSVIRSVYIFHTVLKKAHRDIKHDNFLLNAVNPDEIVLADYGFARDKEALAKPGTLGYAPPEINNGKYPVDAYAWDAWSTGIVLQEIEEGSSNLFSLQFARNFKDFHAEAEAINSKLKPLDYFKGIIWELLRENPNQRKSIINIFREVRKP